jgi:hypothetical protein
MSKYDEQVRRWEEILGDATEESKEGLVIHFFEYLEVNLQLPCEVTGVKHYEWEEEAYVFGGLHPLDHERLKKIQPSYKDKYELLDIDQEEVFEWKMFHADIIAHVRCKSDGKEFFLGLAELQVTDKKTANFQLIDDYATWLVNNL